MSHQGCMSDLPSHLLIDVLSRLPINTVFHCRCVSKTWINLLSGPEFVKLHLSRSPATLIINRFQTRDSQLLKLFQLEHIFHPAMILDHSSIGSDMVLLGCSNGFLLLNSLSDDNLYICNPITREYITLPRAEGKRRYPNLVAHGFGYKSRNEQYKVIRIYQEQTIDDSIASLTYCRSEIQVYELGSGSWRSVGHVSLSFGCRLPGILLNGNLHWLIYDFETRAQSIFSFDLEHESFQSLPLPPGTGNGTAATLGVLDGSLYLCNNVTDFDLELWVMKEYGVKSSWTKQFVISRPDDYWLSYICVHALTVLRDGEILFRWRDDYLFSYHPEKKTTKNYDIFESCFDAKVDVLSFLSLKNFKSEEVRNF